MIGDTFGLKQSCSPSSPDTKPMPPLCSDLPRSAIAKMLDAQSVSRVADQSRQPPASGLLTRRAGHPMGRVSAVAGRLLLVELPCARSLPELAKVGWCSDGLHFARGAPLRQFPARRRPELARVLPAELRRALVADLERRRRHRMLPRPQEPARLGQPQIFMVLQMTN